MDWTPVLAIATVLMAAGTFYLGWEGRSARVEGDRSRRCRAFRAALVDLSDECRVRSTTDPTADNRAAATMAANMPRFEGLNAFLSEVTLPGPLLERLLWQSAQAREEAEETVTALALVNPAGAEAFIRVVRAEVLRSQDAAASDPDREKALSTGRTHHALALDHLQAVAALIRAEARRQGFGDLADAFADISWFKPRDATLNRAGNEVQWFALLGAPPFPAGSAYAECSPAARDAAAQQRANELSARLQTAEVSMPRNP